MTTYAEQTYTCAVCGAKSRHHVLASTNQFGSCDLDTRPPEMMRGAMMGTVKECRKCGYVGTDLSEGTPEAKDIVKSQEYKTCDGISFQSRTAQKWYRYYLLCKRGTNQEKSFHMALRTAWACDDAGDDENAVICRKLALNHMDVILRDSPQDDTQTYRVIKSDLLRRTGQFAELIAEYEGATFAEDILNKIVAFEIKKAKESVPAHGVDDGVCNHTTC